MTQPHAKWVAFLLLTLVLVPRIDAARVEGPVQGPPLPAQNLSDTQLREKLIALVPTRFFGESEARRQYEELLTEVVRRGGAEWEAFLSTQLPRERNARAAREEALRDANDKSAQAGRRLPWARASEVELLTALRRVQKALDPLGIVVDPKMAGTVACEFPSLPRFPVALVNRDPEKQTVMLTDGGDYRSGRQARWRFDVRDERGRAMPVRESFGWGIGGGLSREEAFRFGRRWETKLDMSSFVPALPPGRYTVRIRYHNTLTISEMQDVDGLLTSESPPITLVVSPARVELAEGKRREIEAVLKELDGKGRLKIVAGTYGPWAHELVPPESAHGKLLAFGFDAVPVLLHTLDDKALSPLRRQMVLSLLFSLTGENDPTYEDGVIGWYQRVDGPWEVHGGGVAGTGFGGEGSGGGYIDIKKQLQFSARWEPWRNYIRVDRPAAVD